MNTRFNELVAIVLKHEGGYVNDPKDPGGETNYGISKRAFPREDIKAMTPARAAELYKTHYWDQARCDEVPAALQAIYFDTAVNCGVLTAVRLLQMAAGVTADGQFGTKTRTAAASVTVAQYAQQRLDYYGRCIARNSKLERFRKGWTTRVRSFLTCLLLVMLCVSCGTAKRTCRRAEGYIQKAVRICPEAAQLRTDTVVITVPGDSVTLVAAYTDPDRDSLRAVIAQLSEALEAERELATIDIEAAKARTRRALGNVQKLVCYHAPVTIDGETARGIMWVDSTGRPRGKCWCKPQTGIGTITTQTITAGDVNVTNSNAWMVWVLGGFLVGSLIASGYLWLRMDDWRYKYRQLLRTKRP